MMKLLIVSLLFAMSMAQTVSEKHNEFQVETADRHDVIAYYESYAVPCNPDATESSSGWNDDCQPTEYGYGGQNEDPSKTPHEEDSQRFAGAYCDGGLHGEFVTVPPQEKRGRCVFCPEDGCDSAESLKLIGNVDDCKRFCDIGANTKACSLDDYMSDCNVRHDQRIRFCNGRLPNSKTGMCSSCQLVDWDTTGDRRDDAYNNCLNNPMFINTRARKHCQSVCESDELLASTSTSIVTNILNAQLSALEVAGSCGDQGCCAPALGQTGINLCTTGSSAVGFGSSNFAFADCETGSGAEGCHNSICSFRQCGDGTSEDMLDPHKCYTVATNENNPCLVETQIHNAIALSYPEWLRTLSLPGECIKGQCLLYDTNDVLESVTLDCPPGYVPGDIDGETRIELNDCLGYEVGLDVDNLVRTNCPLMGAQNQPAIFGPQNRAVFCESYSSITENGITFQDIDAIFGTLYIDPYQANHDDAIEIEYRNNAISGTLKGLCIVGDAAIPDLFVNPSGGVSATNCIITVPGFYRYNKMEITWYEAFFTEDSLPCDPATANQPCDHAETLLLIPLQTKHLLQVMSCPALPEVVNGQQPREQAHCHGTMSCYYEQGWPCGGKFPYCTKDAPTKPPTLPPTQTPTTTSTPTQDPTTTTTTADPTKPPTQEPTTTTTATPPPTLDPTLVTLPLFTETPTGEPTRPPSTVHGDPIVWTFNDECYDLSKDGIYTATKHELFDHHVELAVYNDYIREIQVLDSSGDILLSINNKGEIINNDFPYYFKEDVVECPQGLYDCIDTYTEFSFDAQDFDYCVHILRHNYKDPALKEGEYGWHLDVAPRPYQTFQTRRKEYNGLFFENPHPTELKYCEPDSKKWNYNTQQIE